MAGKPDGIDEAVVEREPELGDVGAKPPSFPGIRCPLCGWHPAAQDRWYCNCGHSWNTFDTGGVCPGCLFQWTVTQCLKCHQFSLHSKWYEHQA